jgi:hypothetical protein
MVSQHNLNGVKIWRLLNPIKYDEGPETLTKIQRSGNPKKDDNAASYKDSSQPFFCHDPCQNHTNILCICGKMIFNVSKRMLQLKDTKHAGKPRLTFLREFCNPKDKNCKVLLSSTSL